MSWGWASSSLSGFFLPVLVSVRLLAPGDGLVQSVLAFLAPLAVVVPLYNEAAHLTKALAAIRESCESRGERYELILVDDGSTDGTWTSIRAESQGDSALRAVRLSRNFGKESALCAGLEMARGTKR